MFNFKGSKILASLMISTMVLMGCSTKDVTKTPTPTSPITQEQSSEVKGNSYVHFIDTGNSDSILIEDNGEFMLIDGGDVDDDKVVDDYLKSIGVTKIKYLLMSHGHADHIGAFDTVVKNYDIEYVLAGNGTATTKTYESFVLAMKEKSLKFTKPEENKVYKLGNGELKFYNVNSTDVSDLNNTSVIALYSHGEDDFLFTGDAETSIELKYKDIIGDIDVLKAGHHGSATSSSEVFLKTVKPEYVVLLTGENSYGHPHKEVVDLLEKLSIETYRSDESGDIIATSTGNGITFNTKPGSYTANGTSSSRVEEKEEAVSSTEDKTHDTNHSHDNSIGYWTKSGKSYHITKDCSALSRSKSILEGTLDEAISLGKDDACDYCVEQ